MPDEQFLTACASSIQRTHGTKAKAFVAGQILRVRAHFPWSEATWRQIEARLP